MIIIGAVLLLLGLLTGIYILYVIGIIVLVLGLLAVVLGYAGRPVGGRRGYW